MTSAVSSAPDSIGRISASLGPLSSVSAEASSSCFTGSDSAARVSGISSLPGGCSSSPVSGGRVSSVGLSSVGSLFSLGSSIFSAASSTGDSFWPASMIVLAYIFGSTNTTYDLHRPLLRHRHLLRHHGHRRLAALLLVLHSRQQEQEVIEEYVRRTRDNW